MEGTVQVYSHVFKDCRTLRELFPIRLNELNIDSIALLFYSIHSSPDADLSMGSIATLVNTSSFEVISNEELHTFAPYSDGKSHGSLKREFVTNGWIYHF